MRIRVHRRHESGLSNNNNNANNTNNNNSFTALSRDDSLWKMNASDIISCRRVNTSYQPPGFVNSIGSESTASYYNPQEQSSIILQRNSPRQIATLRRGKLHTAGSTISPNSRMNSIDSTTPSSPQVPAVKKGSILASKSAATSTIKATANNRVNPHQGISNVGFDYHLPVKHQIKLQDDNQSRIIYSTNPCEELSIQTRQILNAVEAKEQKKRIAADNKHNENASVDVETQLVSVKDNIAYNPASAAAVNARKVKEIRCALQRKYRMRTDFKSVFFLWDENGTGKISDNNVHAVLNRMGFKCNMHEARALIATVDSNGANSMDLQKFFDFIYEDASKKTQKQQSNSLRNNLASFESLGSERVAIALSNKIHQLHSSFGIREAAAKEGFKGIASDHQELNGVTLADFYEVVRRRVDLPPSIISDAEIKGVFAQYIKEEGAGTDQQQPIILDSKKLIQDLRKFNERNQPKEVKPEAADLVKQFDRFKEEDNSKFDLKSIPLIDNRTDNTSHLDWMKGRADRVFKHIQTSFKNEDEFKQYLLQEATSSNSNTNRLRSTTSGGGGVVGQIQKSDLASALHRILEVALPPGQQMHKRDFQGFLEMFTYNQDGYASIPDIPKIVYHEDRSQMYARISQRKRGPPRISNSQNTLTQESEDQNDENASSYQQQKPHLNNYYDGYAENPKQKESQQRRQSRRTSLPTTLLKEGNEKQFEGEERQLSKNSQIYQNQQSISHGNANGNGNTRSSNLNSILRKVEDRLFLGDIQTHQLFKSFDADKDGYVSSTELMHKIKELNVLDSKELKQFEKHLDLKNACNNHNGFLDLATFNSKIHANMSDSLQPRSFDFSPMNMKSVQQTHIRAFKEGSPRLLYERHYSNENRNLIRNNVVQPLKSSAMYSSEFDRFSPKKLDFQQEDKRRKQASLTRKLDSLRGYTSDLETRKNNSELLNQSREVARLRAISVAQQVYQRTANSPVNGPIGYL